MTNLRLPTREHLAQCRMIFSDIDGTLLNDRHEISPRNKRAISRVCRLGIPFVLISSRFDASIRAIQAQGGITGPFIAFGGSLIVDTGGEILHNQGISPPLAQEAGRYLAACHPEISWNFYGDGIWLSAREKSPWVLKEEAITGFTATGGSLEDMDGWSQVHKLLCMGQPEAISRLEQEMAPHFPTLYYSRSAPYYLEITPQGITKGTAVKYFCQKKQIPLEQTLAFGDNYNDLEMLKTAGIPCLMGNAPRELQKQSLYLTASNRQDGIALVLEQLI